MCSAVIIYIVGMVLSVGLVAGPVRVPELDFPAARGPAGPAVRLTRPVFACAWRRASIARNQPALSLPSFNVTGSFAI